MAIDLEAVSKEKCQLRDKRGRDCIGIAPCAPCLARAVAPRVRELERERDHWKDVEKTVRTNMEERLVSEKRAEWRRGHTEGMEDAGKVVDGLTERVKALEAVAEAADGYLHGGTTEKPLRAALRSLEGL